MCGAADTSLSAFPGLHDVSTSFANLFGQAKRKGLASAKRNRNKIKKMAPPLGEPKNLFNVKIKK